jgi:hypothetical protein
VSPQPPDFDSLFAEGRRHDLGHVREGLVATVRIVAGAELRLPSGQLVACEPGTVFPEGAQRSTFVEQVEPGSYPVELAVADCWSGPGDSLPYVAAARVVVRDRPVARWRLALLEGQDDAVLADDEFYGYPVDGGMGAFGSTEVFDSLSDADPPDDLHLLYLAGDLEDFDRAGVYIDETTGNNVVFFHTGEGDGHYGTWVGYTESGAVACFVTHFMTLTADG